MSKKYTRQEAIALCGMTSSKISYLERVGLIQPERVGSGKKPYVLYTEEQVMLISQLNLLSEWFTLDSLHAFLEDERVKAAMLKFLKAVNP